MTICVVARRTFTLAVAVPFVQCSGALYAQGSIGVLTKRARARVCVRERVRLEGV